MLRFCLSLRIPHNQIHILSLSARSCKFFSYNHFGIFLCASQRFQNEVVSLMPNPQPGGLGFEFGVCSPREVGKCLPSPSLLDTLSGTSAETCPAWVTPPVDIRTRCLPAKSPKCYCFSQLFQSHYIIRSCCKSK